MNSFVDPQQHVRCTKQNKKKRICKKKMHSAVCMCVCVCGCCHTSNHSFTKTKDVIDSNDERTAIAYSDDNQIAMYGLLVCAITGMVVFHLFFGIVSIVTFRYEKYIFKKKKITCYLFFSLCFWNSHVMLEIIALFFAQFFFLFNSLPFFVFDIIQNIKKKNIKKKNIKKKKQKK